MPAFFLDLGPYSAALAFFAGIVAYRANPLRDSNRYFAALAFTNGLWQLVVAEARLTANYPLWGRIAAPFGGAMLILIFMLHDTALVAHSNFFRRLFRNLYALAGAGAFSLGAFIAYRGNPMPALYPTTLRFLCILVITIALANAYVQRKKAVRPNPYELFLFTLVTVYFITGFTIFMLMRSPLGSRLLSAVTILFWLITIYLLLSERIFDATGTAKIAAGHIITGAIHFTATIAVFTVCHNIGIGQSLTILALVAVIVNYPLYLFLNPHIRALLASLGTRTAQEIRIYAVNVTTTADSQIDLTRKIASAAKRYLGGLDVTFIAYPQNPQPTPTPPPGQVRSFLAAHIKRRYLTPDAAWHEIKSPLLETVLDAFHDEKIGAVVKNIGPRLTLACFVSARAGGQKAITSEELNFLYELTALTANGLDRIRATDENFRSRALAMIGQTHAFQSHQARNQLEPITNLLGALTEGKYPIIPARHIAAVHQQALDLAAELEFSLELSRIQPDSTTRQPIRLAELLSAIAATAQRLTRHRATEITAECDAALTITTDGRIVRQILLNLIKNSLEATIDRTPEIRLAAAATAAFITIDITDNGPGIRADIHDHLFTAWMTTKSSGTGIGLAFCLDSVRALHGDLAYLTPRGQPHAHFRLTLPSAHPVTIYAPEPPQTANSPETTAAPAPAG